MWPAVPPVLGTSPWRLRCPVPDDAPSVFQACQDADIRRYTLVPDPYRLADAESFITHSVNGWDAQTAASFVIVDDADRLAGSCSVQGIDEVRSVGGVGYWVAPWARGRGAARTAVMLVRNWAHDELGLQRLVMEIEDDNAASIKAATAVDFAPLTVTFEANIKGTARTFRKYEHLAGS